MLVRHGYPAAAYQQTSVETAAPAQLILMLYRRAILSSRQAASAIERKELEKAHNELVRAQSIIIELSMALDPTVGPLAENLAPLYDFFYRQLVDANLRKDPTPAIQVADLMGSLLESWEAVIGG